MDAGSFFSKLDKVALVVLVLIAASPSATATKIEFVATNLADVTPGQDLWRYDYAVSGRDFLQSEVFDIYFNPTLYMLLTAGPPANPDWDVLILQQPNPDVLPPFQRGIFDAFSLVTSPSLAGTFSVTFVFLGSGNPGSQMFEIFDADSNPVESGFTSLPGAVIIPEPSTVALCLVGLAAAAIPFRRRSRSQRQ